jgi:putative transposase
MKTLNPTLAKVLKRLHYPLEVILTCVRWYVAYPLSCGIWRNDMNASHP